MTTLQLSSALMLIIEEMLSHNTQSQMLSETTVLKFKTINFETWSANGSILVDFRNKILMGVSAPEFREGQVET